MNGKLNQISGEVKETTGEAFDDSKLRAGGVIQQGIGKAREAAADIEEKVGDVLKRGREEAGHLVDETREKVGSLINGTNSKFRYILV